MKKQVEAWWKTNNAAEKGTNFIPLPRYGVVEGFNPPMLSFIQWFMLLFVPTKQMFPGFSLESCMEPHWRHCHVAMEMLPWHCPLVKETHMIGKERRRGGKCCYCLWVQLLIWFLWGDKNIPSSKDLLLSTQIQNKCQQMPAWLWWSRVLSHGLCNESGVRMVKLSSSIQGSCDDSTNIWNNKLTGRDAACCNTGCRMFPFLRETVGWTENPSAGPYRSPHMLLADCCVMTYD